MHHLSVATTLPMSKSGANVLLIFQSPVIWATPSQVDILVSDDSPAFSPTMYNIISTWVVRIKNEVGTYKHVDAFQYFLYWQFQDGTVQLLLIVFLIYISYLSS